MIIQRLLIDLVIHVEIFLVVCILDVKQIDELILEPLLASDMQLLLSQHLVKNSP